MGKYDSQGRLRMYLVQHLTAAPESAMEGKIVRAFGGGMIQLKEEAWQLIQTAFNIKPMFASEYEWGAIPNCLSRIAANSANYSFWNFEIAGNELALPYWRKWKVQDLRRNEIKEAKAKAEKVPRINHKKLEAQLPAKPANAKIWVIAPNDIAKSAIESAIKYLQDAENASDREWQTRDCTGLTRAIDPEPTDAPYKATAVCGWLDLENNLFFFTDEKTATKTWELFQ